MLMILSRIQCPKYLAQALAVGLVVLAMAFLAACTDDQDTQAAEEPQPTATSAAGSTSDQSEDATPTTEPASADATPAPPSGPPVQVVATTNFVADWARVVGGDRVEVFGLLQPGGDPHTFIPGTRDVAKVADADLVLTVGLGLEADWLEELLHNASADESKIVALGDSVDPMEFATADMHDDMHGDHEDEDDHGDHEDEDDHDEGEEGGDHEDEDDHDEDEEGDHHDHEEDEHGHAHDHGSHDPHFWFDPIRVKAAVNEIATRLSALDPENSSVYFQNASEYGEQLNELHVWTQEQVSAVAPERRLLVTSHDSLSYFAELYGFEIVGLVIPSLATHVEPSAEHIEGVVKVVREHQIPAVFGETTVSEKLASAVARETGAELVQLYSGSLGPEGSGADTYLGMVRANVERIVEALR